jgi:aryl-alcohol dehydrogenase-like predicted oxidoreductase
MPTRSSTGHTALRPPTGAPLAGLASAVGTRRYAARHGGKLGPDFFRPLAGATVGEKERTSAPLVSSLALGTYLGECDDGDDLAYRTTARAALARGINLLDTAINYRCQRSERALGAALAAAVGDGTVSRDEVVLCTKGGLVALDGQPPATREAYNEYLEREYFAPGVMTPADVVAGGHCLAPGYLAHQLARSRANLGVAAIDVYYLHNPEQQLDHVEPATFRERLRDAFAFLEERVARGEIGRYGCATWNGLRTPPRTRGHLSLGELVEIATEVGGTGHHFSVVQLPINLAMTEAVRVPTQEVRVSRGATRNVPLVEAAAEFGLAVIGSATLMQGQLTHGLPDQLRDALPHLDTDAQRAIAFSLALPGVAAALVGMRSEEHVRENLVVGKG